MAKKFIIPAECHTDDRAVEVKFDAVRWFKRPRTTGKDIVVLAECGLGRDEWGGDYAADAVAEASAGWDKDLEFLFKYIEHKNRASHEHIGFECNVDGAMALKWLAKNRPGIHVRVVAVLKGDN
jgi:hypothetical protein